MAIVYLVSILQNYTISMDVAVTPFGFRANNRSLHTFAMRWVSAAISLLSLFGNLESIDSMPNKQQHLYEIRVHANPEPCDMHEYEIQ